MATASTSNDRVFLFRLQTLIIDGGTDVLRNIFDQNLQNVPLNVFLTKEKTSINRLRGQKTITLTQYQQLYPPSGQHPNSADFDITLIICLLRNLPSLGLNVKFTWHAPPKPTDTTTEADLCRLKVFRNEIAHIASTTGFQQANFEAKWAEIEDVLLRLNSSVPSPVPNLKQLIDNYKNDALDPDAESKHQTIIDQWREMEKGLDTEMQFLQKDLKVVNQGISEVKREVSRIVEVEQKVEELKEDVKAIKEHVQEAKQKGPDSDTHLTADQTYIQMKNNLKIDLMKFYRKQHATVQLSPLIEDEDAPLLDFYVKPEIHLVELKRALGGGKEEKTAVKKFSNVFYQDVENKNPYKEIFITADAGLGKTSFSKRLALTWCHANDRRQKDAHCYAEDEIDAMRRFDFVFLVLLRDNKVECKIDEMVMNQLLLQLESNTEYNQSDLKAVLDKERCLIILDGLDEWTHPENNCKVKETSIPHRNLNGKSTVLTTTRPWKLSVTSIKASCIDQIFEIAGLSEDSANKLKKSVFTRIIGRDERKVDQEVKKFNSKLNANKISDLAVIPILLMFMLCLWWDEMDLGETVSELYRNIIEMLLTKTEKILEDKDLPQMPEYTQGDLPQSFSEKVMCKKYYKLLMSLAQLAFKTLIQETKKENQLAFNRSVADKYLDELEFNFCLKAGILTQSKDRRKLLVQNLKVSFGHKTMQEFFAALYMHSAPDKTSMPRELRVLTQCKCVSDILKMSKVFMFNSHINENMSSLISRELQRIVNEDEITRKYRSSIDTTFSFDNPLKKYQDMCVSCLKEMTDTTKVSLCLQDVFIDGSCKQDQYREILQQLTSRNKHNIRSVYIDMDKAGYSILRAVFDFFSLSDLDEAGFSSLRDVIDFFSLSDLENVEKVHYKGDYNDRDILPLLNESIKCLYLSCSGSSWSRSLMEKVKSLQKLEAIGIVGFTMSHSVLSELYNYILQTRCLKQISLDGLCCTDHRRDCPGIDLDLSGHLELRKLELGGITVKELRVNMASLQECGLNLLHYQDLMLKFVNKEPTDSKLTCTYVVLWFVQMSARTFRDLLNEITNFPQAIRVKMFRCTIEPEEEFERMKTEIRTSQQFKVLEDEDLFMFETIKGGIHHCTL